MRSVSDAELQEAADKLFTCCLQFLIAKEEHWLERIRNLSQFLLDNGYETNFQHKRKALIVRSLFAQLSVTTTQAESDKLMPRTTDVKGLPDGER